MTRIDESIADAKIQKLRERIRKNFPKERSPLRWKKVSESKIVSERGRFWIERHGEKDAARYTARMKPYTTIGHRLYSADEAKRLCEAHASPLPLETPAGTPGATKPAPSETKPPPAATKPPVPETRTRNPSDPYDFETLNDPTFDQVRRDPDAPGWLK